MTEIYTEVPLAEEEAIFQLIRSAAATALKTENASGDLTVLITSQEEIHRMNRDFRQVDRVTDVLTFPSREGEQLLAADDNYLGDIAVCYERAGEQAETFGHSLSREIAFLTVHGVLHLLGYDHMTEPEEIEMRRRQTEIMELLGLGIHG